MKKLSSSHALYGAAALVVVGLLVFVLNKPSTPAVYDDFAQCLTEKGVKMYGAWWCPHCLSQKKLFGSSFEKMTYIECSTPAKTMTQVCTNADIKGYPTWELGDGTRLSGEQSLATLSEKSGCALPVIPEVE